MAFVGGARGLARELERRASLTKANRVKPAAILGAPAWNPGLLSRNGVRYMRCRSFAGATDMATAIREVFGRGLFRSFVPVACGHSRRPNCLSVRLAAQLAPMFDGTFVKAFADRFVSGVSHPKEFAKLPPLEMVEVPTGPALVVDDVATSGFHMHEAILALRDRGIAAVGVVWIAGSVTR